ncbi:hypothetical protein [Streptomyces sp. NPDC002889]|uniref:hypothetical protein n=1 Tax=Streptomyces sp. NPDC002889 TaxID=3364669 RepID=UPI0036C6295A
MPSTTNATRSGAPPPYASLADVVRQLAEAQGVPREQARAANTSVRAALAACVRVHDEEFSLNLRVAPVRQGPAGVAAYLLHESDRLGRLAMSMPRTRGVRLQDEAAWTSLVFVRHTLHAVSRISRRSTPNPHPGGRATLFDQLPYQALQGLAPVAVSMSHVHSERARWERLYRARESGLLTGSEQAIIDSQTCDDQLEWFIHDARSKQRWAAPLWSDFTPPDEAASLEPDLPTTAPDAVIDALEAEAAQTAGLSVAKLTRLRSRAGAAESATLTAEELRALQTAAAKLQVRAAATARRNPQSRPADLLDTYVRIARERSVRFTTKVALGILDACDAAPESQAQQTASHAAARHVRSTLPAGKLQLMCEVDYLGYVREQVGQALEHIEHVVQSKRIVLISSPEAADTALRRLNEAFGGTCVHTNGLLGEAVRIPPPSEFGIRLRRARSCDCGRHTTVPTTVEDVL